jgi:hypothetical protein
VPLDLQHTPTGYESTIIPGTQTLNSFTKENFGSIYVLPVIIVVAPPLFAIFLQPTSILSLLMF